MDRATDRDRQTYQQKYRKIEELERERERER